MRPFFTLSLASICLCLPLAATAATTTAWRSGNLTGNWGDTTKWDNGLPNYFSNIDANLTTNQTGAVTINVNGTFNTANITIGANRSYTLNGGILNIQPNNSAMGYITHLANASAGDTINTDIIIGKDLTIDARSANALTFTGYLAGSDTGAASPSNLTFTNTNSGVRGALTLNTGSKLVAASNVTVTGNLLLTNTVGAATTYGFRSLVAGSTFNITGATTTFANNASAGTGIEINGDNARLLLANARFENNISNTLAIGIANTGINTYTHIASGTFINNITGGTGILNQAASANFTFSDGTFYNNVASGYGISNNASLTSIRITGGIFTNNITGTAIGILNNVTATQILISAGTFNNEITVGTGIQNSAANTLINLSGGNFYNKLTGSGSYGSGIYNAAQNSQFLISGGNFYSTVSDYTASGVQNFGTSSNLTLTTGTFYNNATYGWGVKNSGVASALILDAPSAVFYNNADYNAIGVENSFNNAQILINSGTFYNNSTTVYQGVLNSGDASNITLKNGAFYNNHTGPSGSAINNSGANSFILLDSTSAKFINNVSSTFSGTTYGIYNSAARSYLLINNGTFTNNVSASSKTGILNYGDSSNITLNNGTFTNNITSGTGINNNNPTSYILIDGSNAKFINNASKAGSIGIHNSAAGARLHLKNGTISSTTLDATSIWNSGQDTQILIDNGTFTNLVNGGFGIINEGTSSNLTLNNGTFTNNLNAYAVYGIKNAGASTAIILNNNSTLHNNIYDLFSTTATGILNDSPSSLIALNDSSTLINNVTAGTGIQNSGTISLNNANARFTQDVTGGIGIQNYGANSQILVNSGTFTNNLTKGTIGIWNVGDNANILIKAGTFQNNNFTGNANIYNYGISSNVTLDDPAAKFINDISRGTGISNQGANSKLIINNGTFTNNISQFGYGIWNTADNSGILINNGTFTNNISDGGIGIDNTNSSSFLTLNNNATLSQNIAGGIGIYHRQGAAITLNNYSTLSQNISTTAATGIINFGTITFKNNSTLSQNVTAGNGIYNYSGTLLFTDNARFINNVSATGNGIVANGPFIMEKNATLYNDVNGGNGIVGAGEFYIGDYVRVDYDDRNGGIGVLNLSGNTTLAGHAIINGLVGSDGNGGTGMKNEAGNIILTDNLKYLNDVRSGNGIAVHGGNFTANLNAEFTTNVSEGNGIYINGGTVLFTDKARLTQNVTTGGTGIYANGPFIMSKNATLYNDVNGGNGIVGAGNFYIGDYVQVTYDDRNGGIGVLNKAGTTTLAGNAIINGLVGSDDKGGTGIKNEAGTVLITDYVQYTNDVRSGNGIHAIGDFVISGHADFENIVTKGNGILNESGSTLITASANIHSTTTGTGTGLYNTGVGNITINGTSTYINNVTSATANGIYAGHIITINGTSTFINNISAGNGILNAGILNLSGSAAFTNNITNTGTGIYNTGTSLVLNGTSTLTNNVSGGTGIHNKGSGSLLLSGTSTLVNNVSGGIGIHGEGSGITINSTHQDAFINNVTAGTGILTAGGLTLSGTARYNGTATASATGIDAQGRLILTGTSTFNQTINGGTGIVMSATASLTLNAASAFNQTVNSGTGISSKGDITIGDTSTASTFSQTVNSGTGILFSGNKLTLAGASTRLYNNATAASASGIEIINGELIITDAARLYTNATNGASGINLSSASLILKEDGAHLHLNGSGTQLNADSSSTITLSNNAHLALAAGATLQNHGAINVNSGAHLYADGTLNSDTAIRLNGNGARLAGSGTVNAQVNTGNSTSSIIAAGTHNPADTGSLIGTLTFAQSQAWDSVSLEWQMGNSTFADGSFVHDGTGNDLFKITGTLSLNSTSSYILNVAKLDSATLNTNFTAGNDYYWTILQATTLDGFTPLSNWSLLGTSTLLSNLGIGSAGRLFIDNSTEGEIRLKLTYLELTSYSWLSGNTTGLWSDSKWNPAEEPRDDPDAAGITVRIEADQTADTFITVDGDKKLGQLYFGAENATATHNYTLNGGNLVFIADESDPAAASYLYHSQNSNGGDTISSNLILNHNDLVISAATANKLLITGTITGTSNLILTSTAATIGVVEHLTASGNGIEVANIDINENVHFLNNVTGTSSIGINLAPDRTLEAYDSAIYINKVTGESAIGTRATDARISISEAATHYANITGNGNGILLGNSTYSTINSSNTTITLSANGTGILATDRSQITISGESTLDQHLSANGTGIHIKDNATILLFTGNSTTTSNLTSNGTAFLVDNGSIFRTDGNSRLTTHISADGTGILANLSPLTSLSFGNKSEYTSNLSHDGAIGIRATGNGDIILTDTAILTNNLTAGNGILLETGTTLLVTGSARLDNLIQGGNGVLIKDGATTTINGTSTLNQSLTSGNGIYNSAGATLNINENAAILQTVTGTTSYDSGSPGASGILNQGSLTINTNSVNIHSATLNNTSTTANDDVPDSFTTTANGIFNTGSAATLNISGNTHYTQTAADRLATGILNYDHATLTITDNTIFQSTITDNGTGIWTENAATTRITGNSTVFNDVAGGGAGFYINNATLTIDGYARVTANVSSSSEFWSDGIWNENGSTLTITGNSTYTNELRYGTDNTGIFNLAADFTLSGNSTFNNLVSSGEGIWNEDAGNFTITGNSTFINTVTGGTGIYNTDNSTGNGANFLILDNHNFQNTVTNGNGIYNDANFTITNSTLQNTATITGNAIYNTGTINATDSTLNFTSPGFSTSGLLNTGSTAIVTLDNSTLNADSYAALNLADQSTLALKNNSRLNIKAPETALLANNSTLTLDDSTLTLTPSAAAIFSNNSTLINNSASSTSGIRLENGSNLTLDNSTLTTNAAGTSTGIALDNATLSLNGNTTATITGDTTAQALRNDGAIILNGTSTLNITDSTATNNLTTIGTGIDVTRNATLNITNSTFTNNTAYNNSYGISSTGTLNITDSKLTNNVSAGYGISLSDTANTTIKNSTLSQNITAGIGIYNVANLSISENTTIDQTATAGAAIYNTANLSISDTTINQTTSATAYGIYNTGNITTTGNTTINSTNTGSAYGIYNTGTIVNTGNLALNLSGDHALINNSATPARNAIANSGNLSITGGEFINTTTNGNAIYSEDAGSITIANTRFHNDYTPASADSSGIHTASGILSIDNTAGGYFTNNAAGTGNAIFTNGDLNLTGGNLTNNVTDGTGIFLNGGILTAKNGTIYNNATGTSTGINLHYIGNSITHTLDNVTLHNNGDTTATAFKNTVNILRLENSTHFILTNTTLENSGIFRADATSDITLGESARVYNRGILRSVNPIIFTGGNHIITGTGNINADISGMTSTSRLSPGNYTTGTSTSQIGTLHIDISQTLSTFIYDWQLNLADNTNDLIAITGALNLASTGQYILDLSTLGTGTPSANSWTILTTTTGIQDFNPDLWTLQNAADFMTTLGKAGQLSLVQVDNTLTLQLLTDFYWAAGNTTGTWNDNLKWEKQNSPNQAGLAAHFVRNQTADTTIDLDNQNITIGHLEIGASTNNYTLQNGTLNLDSSIDGTHSLITQHANATQTDTIAANLSLLNNLTIQTLSPNATLSITGDISATNHDITKTGDGTLALHGNTYLGDGNLTNSAGLLYLAHGSQTTAQYLTIAANAALQASNATFTGDITFQDGAIITNQKRLGAKYNDRFTINGSANFEGESAFYNLAQFNQVVNKLGDITGRDNRVITDQNNTIYASSFNLDATASYTLNLYNAGSYDIQDWSIEKDDFGIYYALVISSDIDGFTLNNWHINLTDSSGNTWDSTYWSVIKGEVGGIHGIWLHYSNPNRIPEPSTTAALIAALSLLATYLIKRRKNK